MSEADEARGRAVRASEVTLTENETAWLVFWRAITAGRDPAPTLRLVQFVQRIVKKGSRTGAQIHGHR